MRRAEVWLIRAANWAVFSFWPTLRRWLWRLWYAGVLVAFVLAIVALLLQLLIFGLRDRPSDLGG